MYYVYFPLPLTPNKNALYIRKRLRNADQQRLRHLDISLCFLCVMINVFQSFRLNFKNRCAV